MERRSGSVHRPESAVSRSYTGQPCSDVLPPACDILAISDYTGTVLEGTLRASIDLHVAHTQTDEAIFLNPPSKSLVEKMAAAWLRWYSYLGSLGYLGSIARNGLRKETLRRVGIRIAVFCGFSACFGVPDTADRSGDANLGGRSDFGDLRSHRRDWYSSDAMDESTLQVVRRSTERVLRMN